jgi:hypothetical protein
MPSDLNKLVLDTIAGFKMKADHNKTESLGCFIVVVSCSLISPLFVTLGDGVFLGKVLPSVLSLCAAGSTAWLQLRKPQNLWSLYRDCQRRIEDHLYKYEYRLTEYDAPEPARDKLLADAVRSVAWDAHQKWLALVPNPETIETSIKQQTLLQTKNEPGNPT